MDRGWIKLWRQLLDSPEWSAKDTTRIVFITCLLLANHKDNYWNGVLIKKGHFVTSIENLAKAAKVSFQNVRTALHFLRKVGFLTSKSTNKYTEISITNYSIYNPENNITNQQTNKQLTNNQQTTNKQLTTNKNVKNVKNVKNDKKKDVQSDFLSKSDLKNEFEHIWSLYPKRSGKKDALRHYLATVKTPKDVNDCNKALINYKNGAEFKKGYIKNGSTWFNNWQDWVTPSPLMMVNKKEEKQDDGGWPEPD